MGSEWLNLARQTLESAGFAVEEGYPGRRAPVLEGPAVALNLTGVDLGEKTAGITAAVLVPRKMGLALAQEKAEEAARALQPLGGKWRFEGHSFDSHLDGYCVEVRGKLSVAEEPGYRVSINGGRLLWVTDFLARQQQDRRFTRPHGASGPGSVTPGMGGWKIRLTQMVPSGSPEPELERDGFELDVIREGVKTRYIGCCWDEYSSQQTEMGTRVIRTGLALSREVTADG